LAIQFNAALQFGWIVDHTAHREIIGRADREMDTKFGNGKDNDPFPSTDHWDVSYASTRTERGRIWIEES